MSTLTKNPVFWFLAVTIGLSALAIVLGIPVTRVTEIAIYTLYGAGMNLLLGYTGLVPFGASVFFGTAAYAAAIASLRLYPSEFFGMVLALGFSLVLALAIGVLILRRKGLYFSLLTLAFSQLAFEIAFKWTDFTGGENGLQNVPRPVLADGMAFHAFVLASVAVVLYALWRLVHSPVGRVFQAIRDNELRARCLGYDTFRFKLVSFVLSAVAIGYSGALITYMLRGAYANPLSWQHAGDPLLMTVFGGVHHFLGPLWGAITFIVLQDRLSALTEHWWLIFAPIVMAFALLSPEGLQGLWQTLSRRAQVWTLTRNDIPRRPDIIAPFRSQKADLDPKKPILTVNNLGKNFGSLVTARDIHLDVYPYQLHSFIGPNGAGKTTFFNMLTGILQPNTGTITFLGEDITRMPVHLRIRRGLSRSFQIISVFKNLTTFETVRVAVQAQSPRRFSLWRDAHELGDVNARTWSLLQAVGLVDRAAEVCTNLSHGEQRLLDIAVALAADGKLLLLDEPLAGLAEADREVVGRLIRSLSDTHAVLLIEHDIDRVLALSDRITVLHQGRLIADGRPAEVAANPDVVAAYLGNREEKITVPPSRAKGGPSAPLLVVDDIKAGYEGSTVLDGLSLEIRTNEVVAFLGRNGVGKTTTLKAITGTLPVDAGRITFDGADITNRRAFEINRAGIAMVPEGRRLFPNLTVKENLRLAQRPGGATLEEAYELFPKLKILQNARAEKLSGGERQMVAIARALMAPGKVILLDEPFEGLAPAIVQEVMHAVIRLRERASVLIVEHNAELVLPMVDRVYVLVNGHVAWSGSAREFEKDEALQARLLGVTHEDHQVA